MQKTVREWFHLVRKIKKLEKKVAELEQKLEVKEDLNKVLMREILNRTEK